MNPLVSDFERGVYQQAVSSGYSPIVASAIAAQAVIDRALASPAGFAVAETKDFTVTTVYDVSLELSSYRVDQSDGSTIAEYVLVKPFDFDAAGQTWDNQAVDSFAMTINAGGIHGYIDEHGEFRATGQRTGSKSVTEWVRARVEEGKLFISAKFKQGFDWVADKFRAVSIEALVPKSKVRVVDGKKIFSGGELKGFSFTNRPKNTNHLQTKIER